MSDVHPRWYDEAYWDRIKRMRREDDGSAAWLEGLMTRRRVQRHHLNGRRPT